MLKSLKLMKEKSQKLWLSSKNEQDKYYQAIYRHGACEANSTFFVVNIIGIWNKYSRWVILFFESVRRGK